jgi:hypothetical protein
MTMTDFDWPLSFALSAKNRLDTKEQSVLRSALFSTLVSALRGALQRCSYPPHECQESIMSFYTPAA